MENKNMGVKLPMMFADGMVLQRRKPIPVWGFDGRIGDRISVSLDGMTVTTTVGGRGEFYLELPPAESGRNKTLTVTNHTVGVTRIFSDVSVGEVWYMAGQSNMMFKTHMMDEKDKEEMISLADNYDIRYFKIECAPAITEQKDVPEGSCWKKITSKNVGGCSAIAYAAAYAMQDAMKDVPFGFVECYSGGSSTQAWLAHRKIFGKGREQVYNNDAWRPLTESHWGGCHGRTIWEDYEYYTKEENYLGNTNKEPNERFAPCAYYNATQLPFAPYAIAGVVWYQGESKINSTYPKQYDCLLRDLIEQWREDFRDAELPVMLIQLAPYDSGSYWHFHEARQVQLMVHKTIKHVGLVNIAYEGPVSEEYETYGMIHPKNKLPVARRLAKTILGEIYGFLGEYMGPEIDCISVEGNRAYVSFLHIAEGLVLKEGEEELTGFTISYDGEHFIPAKAEIEGNRVAVYTEHQEKPKEIRYCHVNICPTDSRSLGGNLENTAGFPAFPFRLVL